MTNQNWMLYGANGYTANLIIEEALKRNMYPILAGRNPQKVKELGKRYTLPTRTFSLSDSQAIQENLHDVQLVLNAAGPFSHTALPMVTACLKTHTHYLDVTGEIAIFEALKKLDPEAQQSGIMLLPGVGFDVVPTDLLANILHQSLPTAHELTLAFEGKGGISRGTARTMLEGLKEGGKIRLGGKLIDVPFAFKSRTLAYASGRPKLSITIPWGDLSTSFTSTQIPNIEVYIPSPISHPLALQCCKKILPFIAHAPLTTLLDFTLQSTHLGPSSHTREHSSSFIWGEVVDHAGEKKSATLHTPNGYDLTADSALVFVEHILSQQNLSKGYSTPFQVLGRDLLQKIKGLTLNIS